MARAIVTFGRSWQSLAIVRSLGRKGVQVFVGEEAPFAPAFFSRYCTDSFQYPSFASEPEAFLDFMEKKIIELKPDDPDEPYVLVPVHKDTYLFAKNRQRFAPHIRVPLPDIDDIELTHDKGLLADLANELDILIPPTLQYRSLEDVKAAARELTYPQFVKVRSGAAGVGLAKVKTPEELVETFEEFVTGYELEPAKYPLVQGFVEGEDYCVTALFDEGRPVATMTYRNVRTFPRETGAGALRETVSLPEAEQDAIKMLTHMKWHGIAQLDFRKADDGPAHLIELNPRFFGGLPQAVAANVDYPYLLFQVAAGEHPDPGEIDYSVRTESPVTGLLATLDEIAHDDELLERMRAMRDEWGKVRHSDLGDVDLGGFWKTVRESANPKDIKQYLDGMFAKHASTINDVLTSEDPFPALGFLYPVALMLKHRKLSMGLLTSEEELEQAKPRRRLRDMLRRPTWRVILTSAVLYAAAIFLINWDVTRENVGWILGFPARLGEKLLGEVQDAGTAIGALKRTVYHLTNLAVLYIASALLLRESRAKRRLEGQADD